MRVVNKILKSIGAAVLARRENKKLLAENAKLRLLIAKDRRNREVALYGRNVAKP